MSSIQIRPLERLSMVRRSECMLAASMLSASSCTSRFPHWPFLGISNSLEYRTGFPFSVASREIRKRWMPTFVLASARHASETASRPVSGGVMVSLTSQVRAVVLVSVVSKIECLPSKGWVSSIRTQPAGCCACNQPNSPKSPAFSNPPLFKAS